MKKDLPTTLTLTSSLSESKRSAETDENELKKESDDKSKEIIGVSPPKQLTRRVSLNALDMTDFPH